MECRVGENISPSSHVVRVNNGSAAHNTTHTLTTTTLSTPLPLEGLSWNRRQEAREGRLYLKTSH